MKPKYFFYVFFISLAATSLACSMALPNFYRPDPASTETFSLNEPFPQTDAIQDVNLSAMSGKFNLAGGADAMLEGQVRYNVEAWRPTILSDENSLTVSQGQRSAPDHTLPLGYVVNDWDVKLGQFPMNLTLKTGLDDAKMDLGGLPIHRLVIDEMGGSSEIKFSTSNPTVMESFTYQSGTSDIVLSGLANANFEQMKFQGGSGSHKFDFSGDLQRDATVTIAVGLSDVEILVPAGVSAQVEMEGSLSQVYLEGEWKQDGSHYANQGNGPQLTILVKLSAGSLRLVNE